MLARPALESVTRGAAGLLGLAAIVGAAVSCATLPDIDRNSCGNAVVERARGEECDSFASACDAVPGSACTFHCAGPSETHACQYVWDATWTCPEGWGQGADGVCNRPSGYFAKDPSLRLPLVAFSVFVNDLDGDGTRDLVFQNGAGEAQIQYLSAEGAPTFEATLPPGFVAFGKLSDSLGTDGTDDALLPYGPALVTIEGQSGPSLSPKAYAPVQLGDANAKLFAMPLEPGAKFSGNGPNEIRPGFDLPLKMSQVGADVILTAIRPPTFEEIGELVTVPGVGAPASDPVFVDLLTQPTVLGAPDGVEVVLASGDTIFVASPTTGEVVTLSLDAGEEAVSVLPLPPGQSHPVGVVTTGPGPTVHRIRLISADSPSLSAPAFTEVATLPDGADPSRFVALADLNADGRVDAVTKGAVLLQTTTADGFIAGADAPKQWTDAKVADLNGDGTLEVVATPSTGQLLVLQLGTPWVFTPTLIDVGGTVEHLAIDDFDGDGASDIVVTVPQQSLNVDPCRNDADMLVLYGRPQGLPDAPILMGKLPSIERLTPARLYLRALLDGLPDLAVETGCSPSKQPVGDGGAYVGLFFGSTSRAFFAPFSPYADELGKDRTIERVAIGDLGAPGAAKLDAPDGHADVALIATKGESGLTYQREVRVVPAISDADLVDVGAALPIGDPSDDEADLVAHVPDIVVADVLDATPGDEVIVLAYASTPSGMTGGVDVLGRDDGGAVVSQHVSLENPIDAEATLSRIRVFDFDGDGDDDILTIVAGGNLASVHVLENLNRESFVANEFVVSTIFLNLVFDVAALAPAACDGDEPPLCAPDRTFVLAAFDDAYACKTGSSDCSRLFRDSNLTASLAVSDVDGDGLEDLVLARQGGVEVHRQCSVSERAQKLCEDGEELTASE